MTIILQSGFIWKMYPIIVTVLVIYINASKSNHYRPFHSVSYTLNSGNEAEHFFCQIDLILYVT